jgi:hypothetical protein
MRITDLKEGVMVQDRAGNALKVQSVTYPNRATFIVEYPIQERMRALTLSAAQIEADLEPISLDLFARYQAAWDDAAPDATSI